MTEPTDFDPASLGIAIGRGLIDVIEGLPQRVLDVLRPEGEPREISDRMTPVKPQEVFDAMAKAWEALWGETPSRAQRLVLLSQWDLETAQGRAMHNFNLGNIKGVAGGGDGHSWQFFACNEVLPLKQAEQLAIRAHPRFGGDMTAGLDVVITRRAEPATVWFYPNHPGCCFRAYDTLEEGVADYLVLLQRRFHQSWPAVLAGDLRAFSQALKAQHYYTAMENDYVDAKGKNQPGYTSILLQRWRGLDKVIVG